MDIIKVSSKSAPHAVAGAIANVVRENNTAEIQSIGAGATNQAVKAVAIAHGYLTTTGIDIVCIPSFATVEVGGEMRTAIRFIIKVI
jgi:stage V sporulation protein S